MSWDKALDIIIDALKDSSMVFVFVFVVHVLISFFENKLANFLIKRKKTGALFGSLFGLVPQCGTSVLGADLYIKRYITIGTLSAIFLSCSDEAFIAILTSGTSKSIMVLPLLGLKFCIGFIVGVLFDLFYRKQEIVEVEHVEEEHECHQHHHENDDFHKHFTHPLTHSLQILIYVLIINLSIGFIIGFAGEDNFKSFISSNRYMSPLFASIIGLIPNCASSLLLSELFVNGSLSFGALLSGLLVNAGLGMMILLKNKKMAKDVIILLSVCFVVAVLSGYITCVIIGF